MGITSVLTPTETATLCDAIQDPEDEIGDDGLGDVDRFARFMRASKAPPRYASVATSAEGLAGSALFDQVGCAVCHARTHVTAPAGSVLNGGTLVVSQAVGNKIIHPFSDFLLHDIGTGDGIVQNGGQATATMIRTVPLWGTRTKDRHMHDGLSLTFTDSILRHAGQATGVINSFKALSSTQRNQIVTFLQSL